MKRTESILTTWVLLAMAASAAAQQAPPALMVKVGEKSEPLQLAKVDAEVRVFGYVAETKMTMTFRNPHKRQLAGDLYFPLPEGATVSGYGLDIGGVLIDGVAVEKPRAREVFEKIVRQGIDPGLVEWVKGNNFKTRVFPIPAGGTRTIRVDYVTDLIGPAGRPAYHLPLRFRDKVGDFRLRVEIVQGQSEPVVREGQLTNFKFQKWRRGFAAETEMKDAALTEDLVIGIPDVAKQTVLVEKGPDGQHYFAINDFPAEPPTGPEAKRQPPKLVTVLWDASGSRATADHKREIKLLTQTLDYLAAGSQAGSTKWVGFYVDLVVFRDKAAEPVRFHWDNLNRREPGKKCRQDLLAALRTIKYDGGTQMAAIAPPAGADRPDLYLLFSDGISNFGDEDPTELNRPVYVFSSDATTNHPFLRYLAMKTGGEYFNLTRLEDKDVIPNVGKAAFAFLSAKIRGADVGQTYPQVVQPIHGRFTLVGKLTGDEAKVTLNYGRGGNVLNHSTFVVDKAAAADGNILRRLWAQRKVDELAIFPKRNEQQITEVGKEYSIVTPGTSLLVLDNIEQYVEHAIAPPKTLPKMYDEYQRRMDTVEMQRQKTEAKKIDKVLALWKARVKWWETEFKYPKDFKYVSKGKKNGDSDRDGAADATVANEHAPRPGLTPARPTSPEPTTDDGQPREGTTEGLFDRIGRGITGVASGGDAAGALFEAADEEATTASRRGAPGVLIKAWDPKTPYLAALKAAKPDERFAVYMTQRETFGASPAFFLDCAEFFRDAGNQPLAVQILSNVAELELENAALVRVLAHKLAQWDYLDLAAGLFGKALEMRPEEPQSYRDLALVLARQEKYARAVELLNDVVMKHWDERFQEIETIALMELNRLIPKAKSAGADVKKLGVDPRLIELLDVDVRIILTWDADATDIDLWVIEPSGEKAYYGHRRTTIGGHFSRDFTQGYGPEEYCLRKGMNGTYKIKVNYYGSSAAKLLGAVTLQIDVFTNYGRDNEQHRSVTRRLRTKEETIDVAEIEF